MALWVVLDDSLATDELLAGAGAAALGAFLAELAGYQAGTRVQLRIEWLVPALRLPANLVRDTWLVFAVLWRRLAHGQQPDSGFRDIPVRYGGRSSADMTRRALLMGGTSFAPNAFAVGMDADRDVLVVHELVRTDKGPGR